MSNLNEFGYILTFKSDWHRKHWIDTHLFIDLVDKKDKEDAKIILNFEMTTDTKH